MVVAAERPPRRSHNFPYVIRSGRLRNCNNLILIEQPSQSNLNRRLPIFRADLKKAFARLGT
jgi:hypothetical protein